MKLKELPFGAVYQVVVNQDTDFQKKGDNLNRAVIESRSDHTTEFIHEDTEDDEETTECMVITQNDVDTVKVTITKL